MSFPLVKKIINGSSSLGDGEFRVLVTIADHLNCKTGQCNPSIDRLAQLVGMDARSVRRILRRLEDKKVLKTRRGGHGNGNSNQYSFPGLGKGDSSVRLEGDQKQEAKESRRTRSCMKGDQSVPGTERKEKTKKEQNNVHGFSRGDRFRRIQ